MKAFRKILFVFGIMLAVAVLISVIHHVQLKSAVEKYRAELKSKGEPTELVQVLPPPLKPEQNGTELFLKAVPLVTGDGTFLKTNPIPAMKMVAAGKALVCAGQPLIQEPGEFGYTNSWEEAGAALDQNREALALLRQTINRPELDFQIHYELGFYDGSTLTNLQLVLLKQAASHLKSSAMNDLHQGRQAEAVENVRAALALVHGARNARVEISELVRIAMAGIAQGATWEILQANNLSDAQLAALQADWSRLDFLQGQLDALNMENIVGDIEVARWRCSNREMDKLIDLYRNASRSLGVEGDSDPTLLHRTKLSGQMFLWRYWWSYTDELRSLKGQMALVEAIRSAGTSGAYLPALKQQNARLDELGISKLGDAFASIFSGQIDFHSMLSESIQLLGNTFRKAMSAECSKQMTVAAITLKRYQLKHGNYPSDLNSLVPEFLTAIPRDPADGQPLRYRLKADGTFLLYSIGENDKDDNGDPTPEKAGESSSFGWLNPKARDWVWPQPATKDEVDFYYEHQTK